MQQENIALLKLGRQATRFYENSLRQCFSAAEPGARPAYQIIDADFENLNRHLPDKLTALKPLLEKMLAGHNLENFRTLLIPNITLHAVIDDLDFPASLTQKILHPLRLGVEYLSGQEIRRITLVGTRHTMQSGQLAHYFQQHDIRVESPSPGTIRQIDDIRLEVFARGFEDSLQLQMQKQLSSYENVVLACTELSILNTGNRYVDLARLQLAAACRSA